MRCIADSLKQELVVKLKCSKYISILIDGSTDITAEEHANVYVRYVDTNDGSVRENILGVIKLPNSTSSGYFSALTEYLDKVLRQIVYRNKCNIVGLETDGAANMAGHNSV
jgi:hypothetical protein